jgi:hypothetical protein
MAARHVPQLRPFEPRVQLVHRFGRYISVPHGRDCIEGKPALIKTPNSIQTRRSS